MEARFLISEEEWNSQQILKWKPEYIRKRSVEMESIGILIYIYLMPTDLLQTPRDHPQEKSLSNTDFSWFTDAFI